MRRQRYHTTIKRSDSEEINNHWLVCGEQQNGARSDFNVRCENNAFNTHYYNIYTEHKQDE